MHDAGLTARRETPAPLGLEAVSVTLGDALERTSAMFEAGLRYWRSECLHWVGEAAAADQATLVRLLRSRTPLDVLSAEHDWLRARSRSLLDSGLRLVDAFAGARSASVGAERLEMSRRKA